MFPSTRFWQKPRRRGSAPRRASIYTRMLYLDPQHSPASHSSKEAPTRPLVMTQTPPRTTSRRALLYWYGPRTVSPISTRLSLHTDTRPRACYPAAPRRCPRRSGPPSQQWAAVLVFGGGTRRAARAGRPAPVQGVPVFGVLEAVRASSSESCAAAGRASSSHTSARAAGSLSEACTPHMSAVLPGRPWLGVAAAPRARLACVGALGASRGTEPARTACIICAASSASRARPCNIRPRSYLERDVPTGSGEPWSSERELLEKASSSEHQAIRARKLSAARTRRAAPPARAAHASLHASLRPGPGLGAERAPPPLRQP